MQKLLLGLSFLGLVGCGAGSQSSLFVGSDNAGIMAGENVTALDEISKVTVGIVGIVTKKASDGTVEEFSYGCTGSLLNQKAVLTAAHCVAPTEGATTEIFVLFGLNLEKIDRENTRLATQIFAHPNYGTQDADKAGDNDIAVLGLNAPAPAGYKAATLLPELMKINKGQNVILAGYGLNNGKTKENDNNLKKVTIPAVEEYSMTVLLDQRGAKGACHGDSGGPGFISVAGKLYQFGITTSGIGENGVDDCSYISLYTKPQAYRAFLTESLAKIK